jgi:hypothetical protein
VTALDGPGYQSLVGSKNTRKTKALQRLRKRSVGRFIFAKINSRTYRVDAPNKKAAGWLMEIAWPGGTRQRWVARIGNQASETLSLEEAKQAATAMLCKPEKAEARDWIAELNQTAATEVDRAVIERQRRQWPLKVMGANNRQAPRIKVDAKAVLDTERVLIDDEPVTPRALQGDDYPLEYYENAVSEIASLS